MFYLITFRKPYAPIDAPLSTTLIVAKDRQGAINLFRWSANRNADLIDIAPTTIRTHEDYIAERMDVMGRFGIV